MKVEYLDMNSFDDLKKYKEKYEEIFEEISWEEFPNELFSKKPFVYSYYFLNQTTNEQIVINIPFCIKDFSKYNDTIYILYNNFDNDEKYLDKFKKKLKANNFDPNKFENITNDELAKRYVNGYYELILT